MVGYLNASMGRGTNRLSRDHFVAASIGLSVVVDDLDVEGVGLLPAEAQSPLVVDSDRVLAFGRSRFRATYNVNQPIAA